jgi:hypothetical protein
MDQKNWAFEVTSHDSFPDDFRPFTRQEAAKEFAQTKNKKAEGPDGVFNQHLKAWQHLMSEMWTQLLNEGMKNRCSPQSWIQSTIKILCESKGNTNTPDFHRGTALKNNVFRVFLKFLTKRTTELVEPHYTTNSLDSEQAHQELSSRQFT